MTQDKLQSQHVWMQMFMVPVEIDFDPDNGEPVLIAPEDAFNQAMKDPRVGCFVCDKSLDEVWGLTCAGPELPPELTSVDALAYDGGIDEGGDDDGQS